MWRPVMDTHTSGGRGTSAWIHGRRAHADWWIWRAGAAPECWGGADAVLACPALKGSPERSGDAGAMAYSGRVRGSPNLASTLLSLKPVMALMRSPARVSTISPCAWPSGACGSRR